MKEHENELSPECKAHVAEMIKKRQDAREACGDDIVRFCVEVKPGGDRISNCLKEHENELSPRCKAKMEKRQQKKAHPQS